MLYDVCACWRLHTDTFVGFMFGFLFGARTRKSGMHCLTMQSNMHRMDFRHPNIWLKLFKKK